MESEKRLYKKMVRLVVMVKKKEDINKLEELAKKRLLNSKRAG